MNTRKSILILATALAAMQLSAEGSPESEPLLKFGVVSDVHIGEAPKNRLFMEGALRWLAAQNVDAVVFTGDLAHSGLISELEIFAAIWNQVFPDCRGPNGEKVEIMIATGNHDIDAWGGRWRNYTEEELAANRFFHGDNPEKTWRRLFGQKWEPTWRREVKGYTFLGAQWRSVEPHVEEFVAETAPALDPGKPFFFCHHAHPKGTCHGWYSDCDDGGLLTRALSPFPNAVALSGHTHCALADEKSVWQGAFTSIGAGCAHLSRRIYERPEYVNGAEPWHPSYQTNLMAPVSNEVDGQDIGGDFELVEVFSDHLVVHRRSATLDEPIGPAWTVPLPARADGPLDFARRAAEGEPPQFPADAAVRVEFFPNGHALEGPGHRGEPCIAVSFPHAANVGGHRVFDYEIVAEAEGAETIRRRIMAPGFSFPEKYADLPGTCLFTPSELPQGKPIRFTVIPRDCFGGEGRAINAVLTP